MLVLTPQSAISKAKVKPQQYGPLSFVQYCVARNAERLGIDPKTIIACLPIWERVGNTLHDVSPNGRHSGTMQNVLWMNNGQIYFNGSDSRVDCAFYGDEYPVSMFGNIEIAEKLNDNRQFFSYADSSVEDSQHRLGIESNSYEIVLSDYDGSLHTTNLLEFGQSLKVAIGVWPSNSERYLYSGKVKSSASTDTANITGSNRITLGVSADSTPYGYFKGYMDFFLALQIEPSQELVYRINKTPYALLQPVSVPLYFDMGAGERDTLSVDTAWRTLTSDARAISWRILDQVSQSTGWAIYNAAALDTSWKLLTTLDQATAWQLLAQQAQGTSWKLLNKHSQDTSWSILTRMEQDTAWSILTTGVLEQATAWRIFNANTQITGWRIQAAATQATAWQLLNSIEQDTAWQALTSTEQTTEWRIKAALQQDTSWKVFIVHEEDVAWQVMHQLDQQAGWQIFNTAELDTAWALNSDTIPEPIKTFAAHSKTFAFNANNKTFVFKAK